MKNKNVLGEPGKIAVRTAKNLLLAGCLVSAGSVWAGPFTHVRIGDNDGFGFKSPDVATLFAAANTLPSNAADIDGDGKLEVGEFLPDLGGLDTNGKWTATRDGKVKQRSGDEFDNRSAEEIAGTAVSPTSGAGYTNIDTRGSQYTDISISQTYDISSPNGEVYSSQTGTRGRGGPFPDPEGSGTLPNQPGFLFNFIVGVGDIDPTKPVFFNMVFGDYGFGTASVAVTRRSKDKGVPITVPAQPIPQAMDGEIREVSTQLEFSDVFAPVMNGGQIESWHAWLEVDFDAQIEPYTAFDYVELSVNSIPTSGTLYLLGAGLLGLGLYRRKD